MATNYRAPRNNKPDNTTFFSNLSATVVLAALIALGVYVNTNSFIIGDTSTPGYHAVDLDTTSWNAACTIVGTAVGILSTISFYTQGGIITRRELASDKGVRAMFLRPLTPRRGVEQIVRLQLPVERTLLVLLTVVTALTSAATVALFGIRTTTDEIVNPTASFPLADLNETFFENIRGGSVIPVAAPVNTPQIIQLSGFLY